MPCTFPCDTNVIDMYRPPKGKAQLLEKSGKVVRPEAKSVPLMKEILARFSNKGDLVIDPFAGTASLGIACLHLGRMYLGCEKDAQVHELANERLVSVFRGLIDTHQVVIPGYVDNLDDFQMSRIAPQRWTEMMELVENSVVRSVLSLPTDVEGFEEFASLNWVDIESSPVRQTILNLECNFRGLEVKTSTMAELHDKEGKAMDKLNGLFAAKDFKKNDFITTYWSAGITFSRQEDYPLISARPWTGASSSQG